MLAWEPWREERAPLCIETLGKVPIDVAWVSCLHPLTPGGWVLWLGRPGPCAQLWHNQKYMFELWSQSWHRVLKILVISWMIRVSFVIIFGLSPWFLKRFLRPSQSDECLFCMLMKILWLKSQDIFKIGVGCQRNQPRNYRVGTRGPNPTSKLGREDRLQIEFNHQWPMNHAYIMEPS